jgi:CubicO group peptidase (beta-lactamase class C family)
MGTANRLIAWGLAALCGAASAAEPAPTPATPHAPTTATVTHSLERSDVESWLDGFMPYALERGDSAGAVVAVVKNGAVLLVKGYGFSNVDTRAPVDPERTLFRPGSTSKLFTWTAVMQLVEQGKLDLDRDVNEYLGFRLPARDDGPITLREIMTHTAGFEEQVKDLIVTDPQQLVPLKTYVERATPTRIFKAGTTPAYSNYATALAGYIVERVSGQSFDDYLDAHIFKPLGMAHATFRQPLPSTLAPDMSQGYNVASEPAKPFEIVVPAPAGSLSASGADMARFMIAHLEGGAYGDGRILSAETTKLMHETPLTMIPPLNRMMLGFYEQNYNGHRVISHGGDTGFFHSYLHLFLDDRVGLFVSVNSAGREGAAHAIREALFEQFANRYFPGPTAAGAVDAATATADAKALAGYYDDSRRADRSFLSLLGLIQPVQVVADKDGRVSVSMLKGLNQATRYYREVKPFVWFDADSGWRLAARVADGRVERFSADEVSPFMVFEPVPWWRSPAWLQPAAAASVIACLLTALLWPVAAIVRRRHGVSLGLSGREARGRLLSRVAALAIAAATAGWAMIIVAGLQHLEFFAPRTDPLLIAMYALSVIAYLGGAAAMTWSAYVTWAGRRPWLARLWTTVLSLAALTLLWTAWLCHLMSFQTNY